MHATRPSYCSDPEIWSSTGAARPVLHRTWRDALARGTGAIAAGPGLVAVTGSAGTGKTLFLHELGRTSRAAGHEVRLESRGDVLGAISAPAAGEVLLIDEADGLDPDLLATLARGPGTSVLAGLDLATTSVPSDVRTSIRLEPLHRNEVEAFLADWLDGSGLRPEAVGDEAVQELASLSRGVPRLLTTLIKASLWLARTDGVEKVEPRHVREAAQRRDLGEAAATSDVLPLPVHDARMPVARQPEVAATETSPPRGGLTLAMAPPLAVARGGTGVRSRRYALLSAGALCAVALLATTPWRVPAPAIDEGSTTAAVMPWLPGPSPRLRPADLSPVLPASGATGREPEGLAAGSAVSSERPGAPADPADPALSDGTAVAGMPDIPGPVIVEPILRPQATVRALNAPPVVVPPPPAARTMLPGEIRPAGRPPVPTIVPTPQPSLPVSAPPSPGLAGAWAVVAGRPPLLVPALPSMHPPTPPEAGPVIPPAAAVAPFVEMAAAAALLPPVPPVDQPNAVIDGQERPGRAWQFAAVPPPPPQPPGAEAPRHRSFRMGGQATAPAAAEAPRRAAAVLRDREAAPVEHRCREITLRTQMGEDPTSADLRFLRNRCRPA